MDLYTFDMEGDGLLDEITLVHVIVLCGIKNRDYHVFVDKDRYKEERCDKLFETDVSFELYDLKNFTDFLGKHVSGLICHNILKYDLAALDKLNIISDYHQGPDLIDDKKVRIFDTLVMSQIMYPDRPMPEGCSSRVYNPVTGKYDTVGPHGLAAWGYRVANMKPNIDDWRNQPLFTYMHRCVEDVKINSLVWKALLKEAEDTSNGINWKTCLAEAHRFTYRIFEQMKNGVAFDVEKAKNLVVLCDEMMEELENKVEPHLPERELPKSKQPNIPAKPWKKDGSLSTHGLNFAKKFGIEDVEEAGEFVRKVQELPEEDFPKLHEPMRLANQADIKEWLVKEGGWVPTIFGTKDITKDGNKKALSDEEIKEKAEDYLVNTFKDSVYRPFWEKELGVESGKTKRDFYEAVMKKARALPMSPKFKDERGELCPNLATVEGEMAKDIVKWLSLRSRRTTLLPLDDKKTTGWLNDPRVLSEGRLTAGYTGFTNTRRLKHFGVNISGSK